MPSVTIFGFSAGAIIDLTSIALGSGGAAVLNSGNVLDVTEGEFDLYVATRSRRELIGIPVCSDVGRHQRHGRHD